MTDKPVSFRKPVTITRFSGFAELYADTGTPEPEAPKAKENVRFKDAAYQMDDGDLEAIRVYDRIKYGGKEWTTE